MYQVSKSAEALLRFDKLLCEALFKSWLQQPPPNSKIKQNSRTITMVTTSGSSSLRTYPLSSEALHPGKVWPPHISIEWNIQSICVHHHLHFLQLLKVVKKPSLTNGIPCEFTDKLFPLTFYIVHFSSSL